MNKAAIQPAKFTAYGSFLSVILGKKARPGDGIHGRGRRGINPDVTRGE